MTVDQPPAQHAPGPAGHSSPRRPKSIVVPHRLKWHQRLAASLIYGLIEAVAGTLRFRYEFDPTFLEMGAQPCIFATWHNRLSLSLILYRRFVQTRNRPHRLAAIVSASQDGAVVARILEHFGVQPVRGSSSRRGPQALLELTTWAERGYDLALTPDGPRGPCYIVHSGAVSLGRLTGFPIVPASYHLAWKFRLRSWDRFQVPLPFSRVVVKVGEPLHVPREAGEAELETLRAKLEQRMRSLTLD